VIFHEGAALLSFQSGSGQGMDKFIHRENLTLFKRRLADPALTEEQRKAVLQLMTEEQARVPWTEPSTKDDRP
jgi:hypothetical protein